MTRAAEPNGTTPAQAIALGAAVAVVDGFDLQSLPAVIPILSRQWSLGPEAFGLPLALMSVGFALGNIFLAPLGDRFGRQRLIGVAMLLTALSSVGTATAGGMTSLYVFRTLSGIGLGAAFVNTLALLADTVPDGRRALIVTMVTGMVALGAIGGGFVAGAVLQQPGWPALFLTCGGLALATGLTALSGLAGRTLPERVDPAAPAGIGALLSPALRRTTLCLWAIFVLTAFLMFFLSNWMPTLLVRLGWSPADAARLATLVSFGGLLGGIVAGAMVDRGHAKRTLALLYLASAVAAVGFMMAPDAIILLMVLAAGLSIGGAQLAIVGTIAILYPVQIRATGIGWAGAIGRIGSVVAPLAGGLALTLAEPRAIVGALAVPALVCLAIVGLLERRRT